MTSELFIIVNIVIAGYGLLFFLSALKDFLSLFKPSNSKFIHRSEVIGFIILFGCAASLCWIYVCYSFINPPKVSEPPPARDIFLRVPGRSSVDVQVTSENTILSIPNL